MCLKLRSESGVRQLTGNIRQKTHLHPEALRAVMPTNEVGFCQVRLACPVKEYHKQLPLDPCRWGCSNRQERPIETRHDRLNRPTAAALACKVSWPLYQMSRSRIMPSPLYFPPPDEIAHAFLV
ncbi:hypothetical protein, unlikely [Trypanosoma congolense IL3000]|uniref:Uncharacterized protein n=1 Tax=Trypanosoma congolense (strain IL3000) TaxID=1068625 RepID=F9WAQ8_TRYCI|nr:hypothetical protein, unlikely [Trypanosoma congolense IL3000]